jgi:hypothetical protein
MSICEADVNAYAIRSATPDDTAQVIGLLNETFRTPIDTATWLWYTRGNPLGPSRVYVALEPGGDSIAGVIAFAPMAFRLNGATVAGDYAHHLAYKPVHRNTFSYLALCGRALEAEARCGAKLVIGPPNKRAYPIHKVLGKWFDFGYLDCLRKLPPFGRSHGCEESGPFTAEFDDFYAQVSRELSFCVEKNAEWANWRFHSRPGSPYTVYCARERGNLAGYIVLKRWQDPDGYCKAHILDVHALNDNCFAELLAAAECYAGDCDELNLWAVQGYRYRARLREAGFAQGPNRQPLLARTFDGSVIAYPRGIASLCYGDGDTQY